MSPPITDNKKPTLIVLVSMHRSGSSLITRALATLGVELGDDLMPPIPDNNETGFWEDIEINALNIEIQEVLGHNWFHLQPISEDDVASLHNAGFYQRAVDLLSKKLDGKTAFAFKDPRISMLLPFWKKVFDTFQHNILYVFTLRNPLSVAKSLSRRDGFLTVVGYWLWLGHVLSGLSGTEGERRIIVDYDKFLDSPEAEIKRLSTFLQLEIIREELQVFLSDFLDNSLRHAAYGINELKSDNECPALVQDVYESLLTDASNIVDITKAQHQQKLKQWINEFESNSPLFALIDKFSEQVFSLNLASAEQDETIKQLQIADETSKNQILRLSQDIQTSENQVTSLHMGIGKRDSRIASLYKDIGHRNAQLDWSNLGINKRDVQIGRLNQRTFNLNQQFTAVISSHSWRLTRPLRVIRRLGITFPRLQFTKALSALAHFFGQLVTISPFQKYKIKGVMFRYLPIFFYKTPPYKEWLGHSSAEQDAKKYELMTERKAVPLLDASPLDEAPVKLIAFYLPQFHPIPQNDEWWGEGFTEWTNVRPAQPQFKGHYQPRIPGELGYYDLRNAEVQKRQIELAQLYGIGGFCFYFYWFGGERLLEKPTLNYLQDQSLEFPFCLCWANENWSRRWDGLENKVLIGQKHSPDDDIAFIQYLSQYLLDSRYIRINGRPLLLVYRPSLLPSPQETVTRWRNWCRDNGVGEIYLAYTQSFEMTNPEEYGFDAAIEFPPNISAPPVVNDHVDLLDTNFSGTIYDWSVFVERSAEYKYSDYTLFRGVTPMWDNTARRKNGGSIFVNSSPEQYQQWLTHAIDDTLDKQGNSDEQLVFINAWNEWAEGAYLEPDQEYGYAYLNATRQALENNISIRKQKENVLAIVIHAFYIDVLEELLVSITSLSLDIKLYVTTTSENQPLVDTLLANTLSSYYLLIVENHGRDVLPFLKIMPSVRAGGHKILLKIHTKKSSHREDGNLWRNDIIEKLIDNDNTEKIVNLFHANKNIGMVGAEGHIVSMTTYWGSNKDTVLKMSALMNINEEQVMAHPFVAGTMFFARVESLEPLLNLPFNDNDFEEEMSQIDGTMAHAIERGLSIALIASDSILVSTSYLNNKNSAEVNDDYIYTS